MKRAGEVTTEQDEARSPGERTGVTIEMDKSAIRASKFFRRDFHARQAHTEGRKEKEIVSCPVRRRNIATSTQEEVPPHRCRKARWNVKNPRGGRRCPPRPPGPAGHGIWKNERAVPLVALSAT
jgi:hypothetical protein